ncbi:hypothetical protein AnigIFM56816_003356 [Aspergillus niger]|nr:hypothetical protein AnigIFM56816_003356 [Aspergillus niger]
MPSSTTRNRIVLEGLFKTIMEWRSNVPEDGHINIASLGDVEHKVQFDFENLDNEKSNLTMVPPILFHPMELAKLEEYPVDSSQAREFFDIDQSQNRFWEIGSLDRVEQISSLIEDRATCEAQAEQGLQIVESPDSTFWLEALLSWPYGKKNWWDVECVREPCPDNKGMVYPHIAFHLIDDKMAQEDSILYSEFSAIVIAMRGRANQRKVDSALEREKLDENDGEGKEEYPYLFSDEEYFPVLMVSCVMPQHARLFMACMSQRKKLIIRQSKLYSFERKNEAPVDLFARLFLSKPLEPQNILGWEATLRIDL